MMRGKKTLVVNSIVIFTISAFIIGFSLYFCYNTYHVFPWNSQWKRRINYTEIENNTKKCREICENNYDFFSEIGSENIISCNDCVLNSENKQKLIELGFSEIIENSTPGIVLFYYDYCPVSDVGICYIENMDDVQYFFGKPYYNTFPERKVYFFNKIKDEIYVYARIAEFH